MREWKKGDETCAEHLVKASQNALASLSRDLVYETYGAAIMAYELGAISWSEFSKINKMLVRDGLNNYREVKLR